MQPFYKTLLRTSSEYLNIFVPIQRYKIQRYKDTRYKIQDTRYKDTKIQRYKDTKIQRCKDTKIQRYKDTKIQDTKIQDTKIQDNNLMSHFKSGKGECFSKKNVVRLLNKTVSKKAKRKFSAK